MGNLEDTEVLGEKDKATERVRLVMIKGANEGAEFPVKERTTIGREADVTIADTAASKQHAELVKDDGWKIKDLRFTSRPLSGYCRATAFTTICYRTTWVVHLPG